jgi:hypothetical protein
MKRNGTFAVLHRVSVSSRYDEPRERRYHKGHGVNLADGLSSQLPLFVTFATFCSKLIRTRQDPFDCPCPDVDVGAVNLTEQTVTCGQ